MAYEAAVSEGLEQDIVDMYVASVVKLDAGWYAEHAGVKRRDVEAMECRAVDGLVGRLDEMVDEFGVEEYVRAPIVSDEKWREFVDELPVLRGDAVADVWIGETGWEPEMEMMRSHL